MKTIKRTTKHLVFVVAMAVCLLFTGKAQISAENMAPTGVKQTDAGTTYVKVGWDKVSQEGAQYYYRISNEPEFLTSNSSLINGGNDCVTITDLSEGSTYYVQIGILAAQESDPVVDDTVPPDDGTNPGETGDETTPGTGDETTPGTGDETTPGTGDETTPGTGDETTPGTGDGTTPGTGDGTTPEGTENNSQPEIIWSEPLEVVTATDKVKSTSVQQTAAAATSVTIKWDAPKGADYYEIKYCQSGESMDTASEITSTTNSVKLTGLTKNKKYDVTIYSYRTSAAGYKAGLKGTKSGCCVTGLKVLPTKVTGVKNTAFNSYSNTASFSWNTMESADGYQYYIYDNSNKKIASGTRAYNYLSITSNKLKKSQFYHIKVRSFVRVANNKVKYGSWSDYKYFARSPYQKVTAKVSGKKIKLTWNKVTGANNYTVYVSTKPDSGYKKVATVKKTSTTIQKYGKVSLKSGKTYYIRIVANKKVKVNGKYKTFKSNVGYDYAKSVVVR